MTGTLPEVEDLSARAHDWWAGLTEAWQRAFRIGVLQLPDGTDAPGEDDLTYLYRDAENIRLAGPGAHYPNLPFQLTDLSGLRDLGKVKMLSITDMALVDLQDLQGLTQLESLFIQDNGITSLTGIEKLTQLRQLYCQGNRIESLEPLSELTNLETLNAGGNRLASFAGITTAHAEALRTCVLLPNDGIRDRDILNFQQSAGIIVR